MSKFESGDRRRATGRQGEELAAAYLRRCGYGIIATNWRCAAGEIDIIATDGPTLVFIEVRTRRASTPGLAEESVTRAKQQRLIALVEHYLQQLDAARTPWPGPIRIDVVAIRLAPEPRGHQIHHLRHAVERW